MTVLLVPLVLLTPAMLLIVAVRALAAQGPLGWACAVALVLAVVAASRWAVQAVRTWWASTLAPERAPQRRPSHLDVRR